MFVGHLGLALAAKRASPKLSLGWLMAGVTALDLLWPLFLLAGVEHVRIQADATAFNPLVFDSYPWSHSLVMAVVWGILLMALAKWLQRPVHPTYLLVALVVSHWVLDFISHAPDMPLWPGPSPRLGLGLWNSIPATFVVEGGLWIAGIAMYLTGRRATGWVGPVAFWSLVIVCTVMWAAGPFSPPPPSAQALAWFALIGWIILPWSALADRHYGAAEAAASSVGH
jgi:membrane-bound metal-dependent hydrolase YbcI (DUF457 family)